MNTKIKEKIIKILESLGYVNNIDKLLKVIEEDYIDSDITCITERDIIEILDASNL